MQQQSSQQTRLPNTKPLFTSAEVFPTHLFEAFDDLFRNLHQDARFTWQSVYIFFPKAMSVFNKFDTSASACGSVLAPFASTTMQDACRDQLGTVATCLKAFRVATLIMHCQAQDCSWHRRSRLLRPARSL